jgi:hypothetical protein
MTTGSASYHKVRVGPASDPGGAEGTFLDFLVWDAISLIRENGQEILFNVNGMNAIPASNQLTHLLTVTNPDDSTQSCQFEILDAVSLISTNGQELLINSPVGGATIYTTNYNVDPVSGGDIAQTENAIVSSTSEASRLEFITVIGNGGPVDPTTSPSDYILSSYPNGISTMRTNGQEFLINRFSGGPFDDTTQYNEDGSPPTNSDPNVYAVIPDGAGLSMGRALVSQGMLWQVCNLSSNQLGPWMRLVLAYSAPEGSTYNNWQAYSWIALTDIIPGYICADDITVTLQVPPSAFDADYGQIFATTLSTQVFIPELEGIPGSTGYAADVLFNLRKLVVSDPSNFRLNSPFTVNFAFDVPVGGTIFWILSAQVSYPGPDSKANGEHGYPWETHSIVSEYGGARDHTFQTLYFQFVVNTNLTMTINGPSITPF